VLLTEGRSALLGSGLAPRASATVPFGPASRLVLYTDGLIERRGEAIDVGYERLATAVGRLRAETPGAACEALVTELAGDEDDVAVLVVDRLAVLSPDGRGPDPPGTPGVVASAG
jgi:hypothetical protein